VQPKKSGSRGKSTDQRSTSRLQAWLVANGFTAAQLEKDIRMRRQSLQQIREGRDCRLSTARRILGGCQRLARRKVRMDEIFDLEGDDGAWLHRISVSSP